MPRSLKRMTPAEAEAYVVETAEAAERARVAFLDIETKYEAVQKDGTDEEVIEAEAVYRMRRAEFVQAQKRAGYARTRLGLVQAWNDPERRKKMDRKAADMSPDELAMRQASAANARQERHK